MLARQGGLGVAGEAAINAGRGDPGRDFGGLGRPAEAEALHVVDARGTQEQMLLGGLDALRRHLHAETAAEADHGVNDRRGVGRLLDAVHEAPIDLEFVERESAQIKQARIAGAEIVERKAHAARLELQHCGFRAFDVAEQRGLGEFEFEPFRVESGFRQYSLDHVDEVEPAELQRRNVDRNRDPRPRQAVDAGPPQHLGAEFDNEAGVLGDRDEFGRRDEAAGRMQPARQRLDADHLVAAGVEDRLVEHLEAVVRDGLAQVLLDELALRQVGVHHGVIDAGTVAAFVLRPVQRHVGVAHDVGRAAGAPVDHGNADAGADDDGVAADRVGRAQRRDHAACDFMQRGVVGGGRGDHREFVAAEPCHEVVAAHHARQPQRDIADQLVADRMAERIVDVLEVVEVDVEHRRRRQQGALDVGDRGLEPVAEEVPVRQPAQRVVQRQIAQPVLAGGDGGRGVAHVTEHEAGEHA